MDFVGVQDSWTPLFGLCLAFCVFTLTGHHCSVQAEFCVFRTVWTPSFSFCGRLVCLGQLGTLVQFVSKSVFVRYSCAPSFSLCGSFWCVQKSWTLVQFVGKVFVYSGQPDTLVSSCRSFRVCRTAGHPHFCSFLTTVGSPDHLAIY